MWSVSDRLLPLVLLMACFKGKRKEIECSSTIPPYAGINEFYMNVYCIVLDKLDGPEFAVGLYGGYEFDM